MHTTHTTGQEQKLAEICYGRKKKKKKKAGAGGGGGRNLRLQENV